MQSAWHGQNVSFIVIAYLDGFSPNVVAILEQFEFRNQIPKPAKENRIGPLIQRFTDHGINLGPYPAHASSETSGGEGMRGGHSAGCMIGRRPRGHPDVGMHLIESMPGGGPAATTGAIVQRFWTDGAARQIGGTWRAG